MSTQPQWKKSSWSSQETNCVEVAWKKSTWSNQETNCVQVGFNLPERTLVRDSKLGDSSPVLNLSTGAFADFITTIKSGALDV